MKFLILISLCLFPFHAFAKDIKVSVKGMVCGFCAQGIIKKFKEDPSVTEVEVSLEKKSVTLTLKDKQSISDEKIKDILEDSGYGVDKIERP